MVGNMNNVLPNGWPLETEPGIVNIIRFEMSLNLTQNQGQVRNGRTTQIHRLNIATRATFNVARWQADLER